jgi:hypothetical protein
VDAILPYSVPSTAIETIQLFDILHQPQRRLVKGTARKYHWYSQSVAMLQS